VSAVLGSPNLPRSVAQDDSGGIGSLDPVDICLRRRFPPISPITHGRPLIGVTADLVDDQIRLRRSYARSVTDAGGIAVPLFPHPGSAAEIIPHLDGVILSGGDDPDTTRFDQPVHSAATLVAPDRQTFELELLDRLEQAAPDLPVLGICLGMQMMGLHAGGHLDQHLPDHLETADQHRNGATHPVRGRGFDGIVHSHHVQALDDPGRLDVVATAPDGVIEAVEATARRYMVGVQWHPERTDDPSTGAAVFGSFIEACRGSRHQ